MAQRLESTPSRVVKFGSQKTELKPRGLGLSHLMVLAGWDASSGGTYMWHMILEDVLSRYTPGKGRLRVVIVTDGYDVESPAPYCGLEGMDPMQRELLRKGYDIEFHVVLVT